MVKYIKIKAFFTIFIIIFLLTISTINVFAVSNVNGTNVEEGDIVSYVLKLEDVKDSKLMGINVSITYDSDSLKLIKDTATMPAFSDAIYNLDEDGVIYFNAASISSGYEITNDTIIFSAAFEVKENAREDIKIEANIEEIYADLDDDGMPIIAEGYEVEETIQEGTLSDIVKPTSVDAIESSASEADSISQPEESNNIDSNTIIMIIGAVVVVGLILVVIVLTVKKKNSLN